jgi:hypothetical protein
MSRNGYRDRQYILTHNWLDEWESSCDQCGEYEKGSLAKVFAFLWRHRKSCPTPKNDRG